MVWTKLAYVLGVYHPVVPDIDSTSLRTFQVSFFDYLWSKPLAELVQHINDQHRQNLDQTDLAAKLNDGIATNADRLRSFKQTYTDELRGIVDLAGEFIPEILAAMAHNEGILAGPVDPEEQRRTINKFKNMLVYVLEKDIERQNLRTLHILASLHASLRWDKRRRFAANDVYDFDHAAAAIGYCDAFFTERSLCSMVKENHIALDKMYGCHVVYKFEDAISWTSKFLGTKQVPFCQLTRLWPCRRGLSRPRHDEARPDPSRPGCGPCR